MAVVEYTIINQSVDTTATINRIEIATTLSQMQHHLNLSGWNEPWNTGYTDFTGDDTTRSSTKTYVSDISPINGIVVDFSTVLGNFIYFDRDMTDVQSGWTVTLTPSGAYVVTETTVVGTSGTNWLEFADIWDNDPQVGESIQTVPPEFILTLNNVTDLEVGWQANGNGYSGETIERIDTPDQVKMSGYPSSTPTPGGSIVFTSDGDTMLEIAPGASKTFSMDYTRVTSSLGTYTSDVVIYGEQGSAFQKVVNNFMIISAAPVTDPTSPFYDPFIGGDGGDGVGAADPGDCSDTADPGATSCDAGGGGSCFLGNTMIKMFDGTEKPISEIKKDDLVLDAFDHSNAVKVLGIKKTMTVQGTYMFSPIEGHDPFMTEEHPFYDQDGNINAISDLVKVLSPWFKDVKKFDTDNKYVVTEPTVVYNLFLQQGHTHYANGVPVDNIVGNGGTYILYYLGLIDYETYNAHARNTERADYSPQMKVFYRKFLNLLGNYVLTHNNWLSKKILKVGVYSLTNKSKSYGYWHKFAKSPAGKLLTRLL